MAGKLRAAFTLTFKVNGILASYDQTNFWAPLQLLKGYNFNKIKQKPSIQHSININSLLIIKLRKITIWFKPLEIEPLNW